MSCPMNWARPAYSWRATAPRRSPARSSMLIADTKSWGCDPNHPRRISAINAVTKRKKLAFFQQFELRVSGEKHLHGLLVFLGLKTASAIDQGSAGLQERCSLCQ